VVSHLDTFKEKKFTAAEQADLDLGDAPAGAGEPLPEKRLASLCEWLKTALGGDDGKRVASVGAGNRLVDSPAAALNTDKHLTASMRRVIQAMGRDGGEPPAPSVKLEINPRHSLIHKLDDLRDTDPAFAKLIAEQIFANALLSAGLLDNPRDMTARIYEILETAAARK
jgi:molecular chaperone HtpG